MTTQCPFCNEVDFDLVGLKNHLTEGRCDVFNKTVTVEQERKRKTKNGGPSEFGLSHKQRP